MNDKIKTILLVLSVLLISGVTNAQFYGYFGKKNGFSIKTLSSAHISGIKDGLNYEINDPEITLQQRIRNTYLSSNIKNGFGLEYYRFLNNHLKIGANVVSMNLNVFKPYYFENSSTKYHRPQNALNLYSYEVIDVEMIRANRKYLELFIEKSTNSNKNIAFHMSHRFGLRLGVGSLISDTAIVKYYVQSQTDNGELEYRNTPVNEIVDTDQLSLKHIQLVYGLAGQLLISKSISIRLATNLNIGPLYFSKKHKYKRWEGPQNNSNQEIYHPDEFKHMFNYQLFSNFLTFDLSLNYAF